MEVVDGNNMPRSLACINGWMVMPVTCMGNTECAVGLGELRESVLDMLSLMCLVMSSRWLNIHMYLES